MLIKGYRNKRIKPGWVTGSSWVGVGSHLKRTVREGFIEKMTFVQRANGKDIAPCVLSWERTFQAEEAINAKSPEGKAFLICSGIMRQNEPGSGQ